MTEDTDSDAAPVADGAAVATSADSPGAAEPAAGGDPRQESLADHSSHGHKAGMGALALGALGIVYGDIGTSPLYAFRESFEHHHLDAQNPANALGVASVVFWALVIISPTARSSSAASFTKSKSRGVCTATARASMRSTASRAG